MLDDHQVLLRVALTVLGVAFVVTAVCRLRHMTARSTLVRVRRAAESVLGAGAVMALAGTLRPDWIPLAAVAAPAAALAWLAATSHAWRHGQPLSAARGGAVVRRNWRPVAVTRPRWDETRPMSEAERRRVARG